MKDRALNRLGAHWGLDGSTVVTPNPTPGSFTVSSPNALGAVEASAYQLQLLHAFESGADIDTLLEQYPFAKEASRSFLLRCRDLGFLRPIGVHGRPEPPERVAAAPRFIGAPESRASNPAAFTFLGIPFDGNTTGYPGARFGPAAVRAAAEGIRYGLDPMTGSPAGFFDYGSQRHVLRGVSIADGGDVFVSPGEDGPELYARVTDVVRDLVEGGTLPLVVGGDHSLTAAVLAAFPDEPLQVVHLDAHTDLGDVERADGTGLHHGNVFSVVLEQLPHVVHLRQLGLRGVIEAAATADEPRAQGVGMDELRSKGWEAALAGLEPERATYVSLDIDVVDPVFAPSTGTPVPGGLFPHELKAALRAVARHCRVVGMDVMEVARPLGPSDGTAGLAVEALLTTADAICTRILGEGNDE